MARLLPHVSSPRRRHFVPLLLTTLIAGCASPWTPDERALWRTAQQQTRDIAPFAPEQHSRTPPRTIEESVEQRPEMLLAPERAPERMDITLAEVRAASLTNNLDLAVQLYDAPIAQAALEAERAKFESVLFGSLNTSSTDSPTVLQTESSQADFDRFNVGVNIPLRAGGTVTVQAPITRQETNNPFSLLNPAHQSDITLSISQPLLRNAGQRTNAHSIRVAQFQRGISDARTKLEAIRVLANADRAYWNLYAAQQELEVRYQEYQLAVDQLERARRRVRAGDVADIEVTRAESGVAQSLESIIIAKATLDRRQRDLKRIMNRPNLPMDSPTALIPATDPTPLGLDLDPSALVAFAIDNRMEMLELELQLAIDISTIDLRDNARLPLVTLDYTYGYGGLGSTFNNAFDQVGSFRFTDWSLGVNTEIPLGNEQAKAAWRQAVLQRLQRLATKNQRRQAIEQEVRDAIDQLDQNWQRILAASLEAQLAAETLAAEQRQFDLGARTSTDVRDAAANLANAQSREARALADYQIALIDLAFATGTLLGHDRIEWEPIDPAAAITAEPEPSSP